MRARTGCCILLLLVGSCSSVPGRGDSRAPVPHGPPPIATAREATPGSARPLVDHHKHLISASAVMLANEPPQPEVALPAPLATLLRQRTERWEDEDALAELYTERAVMLDARQPAWLLGREEVSSFISRLFARSYRMTPIAYEATEQAAHVAGYFTRGEGDAARHFGHFLLSLSRRGGGEWRIASETVAFPGPQRLEPFGADALVAELDAAGIERAVVLSVAYWFGSPSAKTAANEYDLVQAENDWTAAQAQAHPGRLVAFCSVNPLRDYALRELDRCARAPHLHGLKLHFGNSYVDVRDPAQVEKLRGVFRSANSNGLPIVVHLWTDPSYGRDEAEIFLHQILPEAPDIVVQIAHFAGGGPGYTDAALEVFAEAIAAGDPRTRNLYFDMATVPHGQSVATLRTFAERIRQVGTDRILFGSDLAPPNLAARDAWITFRTTVPLTDAEFDRIARNVAPYLPRH
jgi:predicted TIM-barrel fold metal-dependent hydrolase